MPSPSIKKETFMSSGFYEDRMAAEAEYPYLKKFRNVKIAPASTGNKRGLGEWETPDSPNNPNPGSYTITIGKNVKGQPGGVKKTIIDDMVHAASDLDPEMRQLKSELIDNLSAGELRFAKKKYEQNFAGKYSGSNFESFDSFLKTYWSDGIIQHLLNKENSEIDQIRKGNPKANPVLDRILQKFKSGK